MKKAVEPIISGTIILFLSIIVFGIIISFLYPYFSGIEDNLKYENNLDNLIIINNTVMNLQNKEIGSYQKIDLGVVNDIFFDNLENKVYITQELKNESKLRSREYGNITLTPTSLKLNYVLDISEIVDINNELYLGNGKQTIIISVVDKNSELSVIEIEIE